MKTYQEILREITEDDVRDDPRQISGYEMAAREYARQFLNDILIYEGTKQRTRVHEFIKLIDAQ